MGKSSNLSRQSGVLVFNRATIFWPFVANGGGFLLRWFDLFSLCRRAWVRTRNQEKYLETDFFDCGVNMHDTSISSTQDVLQFDYGNLCYKSGDNVNRLFRTAEHKPNTDIFFFDPFNTKPNLITRCCNGHFFVCFSVNTQ